MADVRHSISTRPSALLADWKSRLFATLDRQEAICDSLRRHSEQQADCLEQDRIDDLLAILTQRQMLIDELTALNAELEPYRAAWPDLWGRLDQPERLRVETGIQHVRSAVESILRDDARDQRILEQSRNRVGRQLMGVARGRESNRAYSRGASVTDRSPTNRFMDERG